MQITSKSLYHSNLVFLFKEEKFIPLDNAALTGFYRGQAAVGARFIDDVVAQTKILTLPALKIKIILERARLRIEDESQEEPQKSTLVKEAFKIFQQLFSQFPLTGFGFNFDIYYRFSEVIRINDLFGYFVGSKILEKNDLRDLGIQFTLEKEGGKKLEQYFIKITAPLEIVAHVNHHFSTPMLPTTSMGQNQDAALQKFFEENYNQTDEVVRNLNF